MNSQLIRKFAFCAVLALACTLIASAMFASAQSYNVTVATDSSSYLEMAEVTISGLVTPAQSGYLVTVKVSDPSGNPVYSNIITAGANGAYSTSFIAQGTTQPAGTYTVSVYANLAGTQVATKTMTYTVAAASTPTPTPIPATPTPTPTPVPATPTPTPVPATPTPAPTTSPTTSPTTQPTTSPTTQPTATPTATPAATSTPQATPTPTAPEFPFTVLAIVAVMAASAAVLLGFKKSHRNLVNAI